MGLISGVRLTIPLEWVQKAVAGTFQRRGDLTLRKGSKYALAGEWWVIAGIDDKGIRLEPVDRAIRIKEEAR